MWSWRILTLRVDLGATVETSVPLIGLGDVELWEYVMRSSNEQKRNFMGLCTLYLLQNVPIGFKYFVESG